MKTEFWITNISKMNVSLADLNLTVKSFSSVNLLDKKHYDYTLEQLENSAKTGSIFKKSKLIAVRKNAPKDITNNIAILRTFYDKDARTWSENGSYLPGREKSVLKIEHVNYEELNVNENMIPLTLREQEQKRMEDDEKFAQENADLALLDEIKIQKHKE